MRASAQVSAFIAFYRLAERASQRGVITMGKEELYPPRDLMES